MVRRLCHVLGILCCRYGPYELRVSSSVDAQTTLHRWILWLHLPDTGLCDQGMVAPSECRLLQWANKLQLQSTILTLFAAIVQLACLVWYLVSYFPMGSTGLRFATTYGARQAASWMG